MALLPLQVDDKPVPLAWRKAVYANPGPLLPRSWSPKGTEMTSMFWARPTVSQASRALAAMTPITPGIAVAAGSCWRPVSEAASRQVAADQTTPGRRGLQLCLGLIWLLDAALQYQPFMFRPSFVTQVIERAETGNPPWVTSSVTWASHMMLHHIAAFNAVFASIQLLIAAGLFVRRTVKPALALSIVWAVFVWWFGESLGGILTGSTPLAGVPGAVLLYALIAVLLWPTARTPSGRLTSAATASPVGATAAGLAWLVLWGSFAGYLLLPANRAPDAISAPLSHTDGQPGWTTAIMNNLSRAADHRGLPISIVLAILCVGAASASLARSLLRPALVLAIALGLLFWIAEGFGGIFTGHGTDPNSGLLLIVLAACFWPRRTRNKTGELA
jgi:hypothetical protein